MNNKKTYSNPCTRCGTERIIGKTTKERVFGSLIITTVTICPNPACQKKVDVENKKQLDKTVNMRERSERRMASRKATRDAEKAAKEHADA